jgi:uncharacterized protein YqgV (UPF0045/DUF77 family)
MKPMNHHAQPISAQISLYPLRQESLAEPIEELLTTLRSRGLDVRPGIMSTLVVGEVDALLGGLAQAFQEVTDRSLVVMVATFSNACPGLKSTA